MVATLNCHPAVEIQVVSHGLVPAEHRDKWSLILASPLTSTWSLLHPCQTAANMALCRALSSWTADAG